MTDKRTVPLSDLDSIADSLGFSPVLLPADLPFDRDVYGRVVQECPELMEIIKLRLQRKISIPEARKRARSLHTIIAQRYAEKMQQRAK